MLYLRLLTSRGRSQRLLSMHLRKPTRYVLSKKCLSDMELPVGRDFYLRRAYRFLPQDNFISSAILGRLEVLQTFSHLRKPVICDIVVFGIAVR